MSDFTDDLPATLLSICSNDPAARVSVDLRSDDRVLLAFGSCRGPKLLTLAEAHEAARLLLLVGKAAADREDDAARARRYAERLAAEATQAAPNQDRPEAGTWLSLKLRDLFRLGA